MSASFRRRTSALAIVALAAAGLLGGVFLAAPRLETPHTAPAPPLDPADVRSQWSGVDDVIAQVRQRMSAGDTDDADRILGSEIARRRRSPDAHSEIEVLRLRWERVATRGVPRFGLSIAHQIGNLVHHPPLTPPDPRRTSVVLDALASEIPVAVAGPSSESTPEALAFAAAHLHNFHECDADPFERIAMALAPRGVPPVVARVVTLAAVARAEPMPRPPEAGLHAVLGDAAVEGAPALAELARDEGRTHRERTLAAWLLREIADLPIALAVTDWNDAPDALRGRIRDVLAAWEAVEGRSVERAFLMRVALARGRLRRLSEARGTPGFDAEEWQALQDWFDRHVGTEWRADPTGDRVDAVDRVMRELSEHLGPPGIVVWLAARGGLPSDAPDRVVLEAMANQPSRRGVLHRLLLVREPDRTGAPLWCATSDGRGIVNAWRELLIPAPPPRVAHMTWLRLEADGEWRAQREWSGELAYGSSERVELRVLRPWANRSRRWHRLPCTVPHRHPPRHDSVSGWVSAAFDDDGRPQLTGWAEYQRWFEFDEEKTSVTETGAGVPFRLRVHLGSPFADWAVVVWSERAGEVDTSPGTWRTAITDALAELADSDEAGGAERYRDRQALLDLASAIPLPEARSSLVRIAKQVGGDAVIPGPLVRALVLAGCAGLVTDPATSALAHIERPERVSDQLHATDQLFWAQVVVRAKDEEVRAIAAAKLIPTHVTNSTERFLRAARVHDPTVIPDALEHWLLGGPTVGSVLRRHVEQRAGAAVMAFALVLLISTLLLRAVRIGATSLTGFWALVLALAFVTTDIRVGPIDLFSDTIGYLLAAWAVRVIGRPARSRAARWGSGAFCVAAILALAADVAWDLTWLDVFAALACAGGLLSIAALSADVVASAPEAVRRAPRRPARAALWGGLPFYVAGAAYGGALVPLVLFAVDEGGLPGFDNGGIVFAIHSVLAVLGVGLAVFLASLVTGGVSRRRVRRVPAVPLLFAVATVGSTLYLGGHALGNATLHESWPVFGHGACTIVLALAIVWCAERLFDSILVRKELDQRAAASAAISEAESTRS